MHSGGILECIAAKSRQGVACCGAFLDPCCKFAHEDTWCALTQINSEIVFCAGIDPPGRLDASIRLCRASARSRRTSLRRWRSSRTSPTSRWEKRQTTCSNTSSRRCTSRATAATRESEPIPFKTADNGESTELRPYLAAHIYARFAAGLEAFKRVVE